MMKARAAFLALLFTMGLSGSAEDRISMKASPQVAFEPAHLVVRTTIEADNANRALQVSLDSFDFYRSSTVELDGGRAPRTSMLEFMGIPKGEYLLSATLFGEGGEPRGVTRQMFNVIATGE